MSLLLVEDDRADAVLVEDLISDAAADIRVVWAKSMADAERELESARPDCVLLDLHLPDASGIDALDRVAKLDATVPIVVLTGLNDEYFGASAVAAGAQDYLVKGRVEPEMLRRALLYAIERKRAELIAADLHATSCGPGRTRCWNADCCPPRCCWTTRASTSSPATAPAAKALCSVATSTTSSRRPTGSCTS